jgi:hypothetical protein
MTYPERWIGCSGPIAWPPPLLDLTATGAFHVDTGKSMFMQPLPKLQTILWQELKQLWKWLMPICYGISERILCSTQPFALKWIVAASNTYCNYYVPMV